MRGARPRASMSVRAAAPVRQGAPVGAPKTATFKSLASVLEAGFRNLSLQNGAQTDSKRGRNGRALTATPTSEGLVPLIDDIEVGDVTRTGMVLTQSIHFTVYRKGTDDAVFPGFPVDGPHTEIRFDGPNPTPMIQSGKITGFFYPGAIDDTIVADFLTTTGNGNRRITVSKRALRAVAVWIKSNGQEQDYGNQKVASDEDEFFDLTGKLDADRHFMDMVHGVYRSLLDDRDLRGEKNKMMLRGLEWPGTRWSPQDDDTHDDTDDDESDAYNRGNNDDEADVQPPPPGKRRAPNPYPYPYPM